MNDTFDSEFCRVQRIARAGSGRIRGSARGQNRIGEVVRRAGLFSVVARRALRTPGESPSHSVPILARVTHP